MSSQPLMAPDPEEYSGQRLVAVGFLFVVLEGIFVALRFVSRHIAKTPWGLDDYLMIPALLFCWGICTDSLVMVHACGVGYHEAEVFAKNPSKIACYNKSLVAVEILYCTAVVLPKLSILALYLRLFPAKNAYRYLTFILMGIVAANGIAGDITSLLSCRPLAKRWDPDLGGSCISVTNFWHFMSLANIVTDLAMLVLPLPIFWRLHITRSQKLSLTVLFLTGSFGLISSIIRFRVFYNVQAFVDGTWTSVDLTIWALVEPGVYLIAACLPNLRPLWLRFKQAPPASGQGHSAKPSTGRPIRSSDYIQLEERSRSTSKE